MKIIETKNLHGGYKHAKHIINDINITIDKNEITGLFGTNGAGKSTVLKAIMGMLYQNYGLIKYTVKNKDNSYVNVDISNYPVHKRSILGIKYLTQDASIFPSFTVKENLLFAVKNNKRLFEERIEELSKIFPDITMKLNKPSSLLSEGQRGQTAVLMVLITEPVLLLLDEPSSGLSPDLVDIFLEKLRIYVKESRKNICAIVIEQQRLFKLKEICDSIYLLKNGEMVGPDGKKQNAKIMRENITTNDLEEFMLLN